MNLLIVDDQPTDLKPLRAQLESEGHVVFEAHDGVDALALLERQRVDVVISDILMPRMDGYRLCHEIRKHARLRDLPIIIYTATYTSPGDEKLALDMGADKYLKKPVSVETLVAALHEVIAQPHAGPRPEALQEIEVLKEYSERLVFKLEKKNMELQAQTEVLRASERKFQSVFEQAAVGVIIAKGPRGQFVNVNRRFCEMLGYTAEELLQLTSHDITHPDDIATDIDQWEQISFGIIREFYQEKRYRRKDGSLVWARTFVAPLDPTEAKPTLRIGVIVDITERKQAEQSLVSSLSLLRATLESTADGLLVVNQTGQMVQFNQKFAELWRIPADIMASHDDSRAIAHVLEQLKDPGSFVAKVKELYAQPEAVSVDVLEFKDGRTFERYSQPQKTGGKSVGRVWSFRDITERKQAEETLRESEERFRSAFELAQVGMCLVSPAGHFLKVNETFCHMLGYSESELLSMTFRQVTHPEDLAASNEWVRRTLAGEPTSTDLEKRYLHKAGHIVWGIVRTSLLRNPDGSPNFFVAHVQDITERKQAEETLEREHNLLRMLIDHIPDSIYVRDTADRFLLANEAVGRRMGAAPAALLGKTDADFYAAEQAASFAAADREVFAGRAWVNYEENIVFPSGERRVILSTKVPLKNAQGAVIALVGIGRDITERKQAEAALREQEERLRLAMAAANMGAWDRNLATNALHWSDTEERLMGYAPGTFPGTNEAFLELIHPDSLAAHLAAQQRVRTGDGVFHAELRFRCKDGRERWGLLCGEKILDESGRAVRLVGVDMDITERKRAEQILQDSQELYYSLVENLPQFVFRKDCAGRFLFCNSRFCEVMGRSSVEIVGQTDADLFPPELAAAYRQDDLRVMESGETLEQVEENVGADGRKRFVHVVKTPLRAASGAVVGIQGIFWDITERKQAEAALRREQGLFDCLIRTIPDNIYFKDRQSRFVRINDSMARCFGLRDPAAAVGKTDFDIFSEEHARLAYADEQRVMETGEPLIGLEEKETWPDGHVTWVSTTKMPLRDAEGKITGLVGISRDITERKRTEEELATERRLLRALVDHLPVDIYVKDTAARKILANPVDLRTLGAASEAEVIGKTDFDFYPQEQAAAFFADDQQVLQKGQPVFNREERFTRSDGTEIWYLTSKVPLCDAAGRVTGLAGFGLDITAHKRLEQERAAMEARLRQQQKLESIGTLAGGVAHEINNPINGIMNYAQLIHDGLEPGSPLSEYSGEILHETQRVATIVRNLLMFSRDEKQSHSAARVTDIIEGTLSLIRTVIRQDQITLQMDISADLPDLKCRTQQIQQVLMNLMTNARDALNERYPGHDPDKVLSVRARLFEKEGRGWIRVTVEDHGTGIPPEVRERMFDPFFTTKPRDKGTGLGLAISHGIVKEHHGEMTVESEPGKFTRLHLDLPVDPGWDL